MYVFFLFGLALFSYCIFGHLPLFAPPLPPVIFDAFHSPETFSVSALFSISYFWFSFEVSIVALFPQLFVSQSQHNLRHTILIPVTFIVSLKQKVLKRNSLLPLEVRDAALLLVPLKKQSKGKNTGRVLFPPDIGSASSKI